MASPAPQMQPRPQTAWKQDWEWWKRAIIYQIYPRSFQDSDGDGCGDLNGIRQRLDYLSWLGVDAIWISPFFPSPMKDFGYDVADYTAVHPLFGSMTDFDALLAEAHARDLKVLLDLVPNHSSDQHPWFLESASSHDNPKHDWYLWSDAAADGGPPNNWLSEFGGSAWQWHAGRGQYYYHAFLPEQPDLNWRNPAVRAAMYDVMRFWLNKGVDGFRVDVMWHLIKDEHLRNNPLNPDYRPGMDSPYQEVLPVWSADQQEVHDVVREMRQVVDEYDDRLLIGEIYLPLEDLLRYYGDEEKEAHLPFNFQLLNATWDAIHVHGIVDSYESSLREHDWPNWVLGNHDKARLASRVGRAQARVAAMLLLTLRGTPTLYNGDELGMEDGDIAPEQAVDPRELNCPGIGLGRDPARTPFLWDASPNAGFSSARPWLPIAPDYASCAMAAQKDDPASLLSLYRRLIALRQNEAALSIGDYEPLPAQRDLFAYLRRWDTEAFLVLLNFSGEPQRFEDRGVCGEGLVEISTHEPEARGRRSGRSIDLRPNEGLLIRLSAPPAPHYLDGH